MSVNIIIGILRIIYAFYMGLTRAEAPYVSVPLNCVLQLVPSAFACEEKVILPYPTFSHPILPYLLTPYPTLPYTTLPTLPSHTLTYPNLPYPTLLYPTVHSFRLQSIHISFSCNSASFLITPLLLSSFAFFFPSLPIQRFVLYTPQKALASDGQDEPNYPMTLNTDPPSH
jgi:hypothetical protein